MNRMSFWPLGQKSTGFLDKSGREAGFPVSHGMLLRDLQKSGTKVPLLSYF